MENQLFVVGLGNPGEKYQYTRHNIGHLFIDYLYEQYKVKKTPGKGPFYFASKKFCSTKIFLVKTSTFMNISAEAVVSLLRQFNGDPSQLLIVCDDFNLPFGELRLRLKGSDGGQKGLRSVLERFNTQDIPRLRMGIGIDGDFDPIDFVLSEFTDEEKKQLVTIFESGKKCIETFVCHSPSKAMSLYNKYVL
ncbi:MAG: aminoacyl-tRNA hydrolase [Methanobacteriota archaeon]|nr:MAG: aminoacyl-tRNA hydrolase [Euryarchaeota archaeon]